MLNPNHTRTMVVRPALRAIGMWSDVAEDLVLGTGIQESGLRALSQVPTGPARGLWQMERATFDDLWGRFLPLHSDVFAKVKLLLASAPEPFDQMATNLLFAAAMCRIKYYASPKPLPSAGSLQAQADYWKLVYNTPLGAGRPEDYVANVRRALSAV
jgi:hypothetical protein